MTTPAGQPTGPEDSRAEQVLSQALRAMAGGERPAAPQSPQSPQSVQSDQPAPPGPPAPGGDSRRRLTTAQVLLIAAILGLLIGGVAGFISLML